MIAAPGHTSAGEEEPPRTRGGWLGLGGQRSAMAPGKAPATPWPGRAQRTPNTPSGRRRRRQHRRGHVAQQVAVALDVGPQARVLALLLVEAHAQPIALIH